MKSAIEAAHKAGYEFVMACNTCLADKEQYERDCREYGVSLRHIDFQRNPLNPNNKEAYKQLRQLMLNEKFDAIHCNTPVGGFIGRLCAKKLQTNNVIYQAHGFHFYKGAPLRNWLMFYPVEKILSHYTDILITIAKDDYDLAKKMHAKQVKYVHGVGVDLNRFQRKETNERNIELRNQLGISKDVKVILSVGELNKNKNHMVVLEALKYLNSNVNYVICGDGELRNQYETYIRQNDMSSRVFFMGYRFDIPEFYRMADLFVFPSLREGIPGAIMEAIATGVPVIASDIRGVRDIVPDDSYRFLPTDALGLARMIEEKLTSDNYENQKMNFENLAPYSFDNVVSELEDIYRSLKETDTQ